MSHPKPESDRTTIEGDVEVKNGDFVGRDKIFQIDSLNIPKFMQWIIIACIVVFVVAASIYIRDSITESALTHPSMSKFISSADQGETLVLIADILVEPCIDDPFCSDDPNNVTQRFIKSMRDALSDHPNIRVERLQQYIYEEGGSELAMEIGQRPEYNAAFVMWGNYVLEPEAEIYIFFDIMERTLPVFGSSYDESYGPSMIQPSMFDFKADLGTHWGEMTAFAAALALYQSRDYKSAVALFDTAAQGIDSLLFQDMKRVLHFYRGTNYLYLNNGLAAKADLEALETESQLKIIDDLTIPLLNNLGYLYSALGDKEEALDYYNQALPLSIEFGNKSDQATTLNNIGKVYYDLGDKQEALDYYNQALPLRIEVGDSWGESLTRYNIGVVYFSLGEYRKAEEQLLIVVQIREAVGHPGLERARQYLELIQNKIAEQEQ